MGDVNDNFPIKKLLKFENTDVVQSSFLQYRCFPISHHLEALGNKYKDLYEFIPQSLEMMTCLGQNFNISTTVVNIPRTSSLK